MNRKHWSKNQFAWFYAILIALASVVLGILFKEAGVYESMAFRSINVFFIMGGFLILIWDYKKHMHHKVKFTNAFLLCVRTGIYYCLVYLPIIFIYLLLNHTELHLVKEDETFNNMFSIIAIVYSTLIETIAAIVVTGILAAFTGDLKD